MVAAVVRHPDRLHAEISLAVQERVRAARADFHQYVSLVLRDERGEPIRQGVVHRVWQAHIRACWAADMYPAIEAPYAHGKTVQCVVGIGTHEVGRDVTLRVKVVCNSDEKARERVVAIGNVLRSPFYRRVFPHVRPVPLDSLSQRPKWTEGSLVVARPGGAIDPTFAAHGITATGIGGRADLLLFDDVVDRKNAIDEPKLRDKVIGTFDDTWMSRLTPSGRVLYIGTSWHQADLTHSLREREGWSVLRMPISADLSMIEMEVYNPPARYPLKRAGGDLGALIAA